MQFEERDISSLFFGSTVRLGIVQLRDPFEGDILKATHGLPDPVFAWRDEAAPLTRRNRIEGSLSVLASFGPSVVAFPEYAVPLQAHDLFQPFVDENRCVLVPGTIRQAVQPTATTSAKSTFPARSRSSWSRVNFILRNAA